MQLGHHRLDRLQPEHLEAFYAELEKEGLASTTVLMHHRVLSRALKVALQRGRIARNVATLVDAPTPRWAEIESLTADEARRLLKAAVPLDNGARWSVRARPGTPAGRGPRPPVAQPGPRRGKP